ncbi:poly-beta-1,6-N-acetyl-D-glucosamine biosynthesis protein PgaD [Lysobacter korlensis]|uniref:Poly-beta-1,6-N-acetyl-D-glucosamine biosynthesis protein PgaD n=1 Tax=Lysobacter korlensis TaxID=553636 RepID=A0ABV6RLL2_9GAMM
MKHEGFIIQNSGLQPRLYRTVWGAVTLAFWAVYFYLWLPAATLLMWVAGVRLAVVELYLHENRIDTFLLGALPVLAVTAAALLIGWAELNRAWFVGKERRRDVPDITIERIAATLKAPQAIAHSLQDMKIALIRMDADAIPYAVADGRTGAIPAIASEVSAHAAPAVPVLET